MALIAATSSLGCESRSGELPVSQTALPIVGGNLATTCQWPTAIMLVETSAGCSGALVHPRVVVTAKHCLTGEGSIPTSIGLGETRSAWAKTVAVSNCYTHPVNDFGICLLAEEVTGIPIVPVMAPCEMSALTAGAPVVEVGFGVTSATGTTYGTKKWISGFVEGAAPGEVDVNVTTGSQDGEYYGDSGGPLFFQMPDATWRLVGEDWGSPTIDNTISPRVSTYKSVPYHVAWAQQISNIDLTPCHDANGWNPTPACTGIPTNPGKGIGSWATMCQGETISPPQPTCQAAPPHADAGGELPEAGADTDSRDGLTAGPDSREFGTGDSQVDSDTGRAYGDVDAADASDNRQMGSATDGEAGGEAPGPAGDSPAGSGGSAGTGGGNADGGGGERAGGAGGGSMVQSAGDDAAIDGAGEGKASDSGGPGSSSDGGDASPTSDGGDARPGLGSDSGRDAGADLSAANARGGSSVDGGVVHKVTRPFGIGCACRSVSDQDAGGWPSFGLLGAALIAARLIRRRTRC